MTADGAGLAQAAAPDSAPDSAPDAAAPDAAAPAEATWRDRAWRVAFRAGLVLARAWWRLRRPPHRAAMVAVWREGEVLLLRQSYRAQPCWPGGGVRRGEAPVLAAVRELREEVGLDVAPGRLCAMREVVGVSDFRPTRTNLFELRLRAGETPRPDRREIVAAGFVAPAAALASGLPPALAAYLAERLALVS